MMSRLTTTLCVLLALACGRADAAAQATGGPTASVRYTIYVASEAGDIVTRIDVGPTGWEKVREVPVKLVPNEISGPHNVAVSPDGRFWYVSIAHGTPNGSIWKYDAASDRLLGRASVGMFPTTIALSADGSWAYVPNSDFHGDRGRQNTISVLYTPRMQALTEIPVCDMPHGARWNHASSLVFVACMMSDELVTVDPGTFAVRQRMALGSGTPMSMAEHMRADARHDSAHVMARRPGAASSTMPGQDPDCLATFVSVSPDDRHVYIACNHSNELQVRDAASLELIRRVGVGAGAYNVEPSPDGRLILVTNKKAQSVSVVDAASHAELARIETSKPLPHGIAFSPDGRYAFVTCESVGTDPGALDVIELATLRRIASLEIPLQPTGIAIRP